MTGLAAKENMDDKANEQWGDGRSYDKYMGRWSRSVATDFLTWLSVPARRSWAGGLLRA